MLDEIIIRNCELEELYILREFEKKFFGLNTSYNKSFFRILFDLFSDLLLVAENKKGEFIGYIYGGLGSHAKLHILSLGVRQDYQGCGLAKELVEQFYQNSFLVSVDIKSLVAVVDIRNKRALQFYKKLGFSMVETEVNYYGGGECRYVMEAKLPESMKTNTIVKGVRGKERGVFATKDFQKGDIVIIGKPIKYESKQTEYTIQMDIDKHAIFNAPSILLNHSCDPNCGMVLNEFGWYNFIAMKNIKAGEEIVWDYCMSEWVTPNMGRIECLCGSEICRKRIKGGKYLSKELLEKYTGFIAPYYEKLYADHLKE